MIRRDYILRMIEEFIQVLARIQSLRRGQLWGQAAGVVDEEFQRLLGEGAAAAAQLTETELLARVIRGEPTPAVREKTLMLVALFKEAGDLSTAQERPGEARSFYLKGLHLLLGTLAGSEGFKCPDFVPQVEMLASALQGTSLPPETLARLMRHYEQIGEFARAEDCLFAIVEAAPGSPGLREFGVAFYNRLRTQSDASLAAGNLPRAELEAGSADLGRKLPEQRRVGPGSD